jgi:hypothetical protein
MDADTKPKEATKQETLALAYAQVFGRDSDHRTEAQRLVWEDMEKRGYVHRSTAVPDASGTVSTVKMEIAEGMRIFHLDTNTFVSWANKLGSKQQKPKAKRT